MADLEDAEGQVKWLDNLRVRLFLAILVTAIPILGGLGYYVWRQHDALIESSERAAAGLANVVAAYDRTLINDASDVLLALASSPALLDGPEGECRAYFESLLSRLPRYVNLGVIDPQGFLVCSGRPDPQRAGSWLGDRDYFRKAVGQADVVLSGFTLGRISDSPTLVLARRILGDPGTDKGVVYAALNLGFLSAGAAISDLLPEARMWTLDRQGRILQRLPIEPGGLGQLSDPHPAGTPGLVHEVVEASDGRIWQRFSVLAGPAGDPEAVSVRYEVPQDALYAEANRTLWTGVLILFLLLCLSILAAWSLMQLAAGRSLQHLREAMWRLATGDFSWRVADRLQGRDLQAIGRQFDVLSGTLRAYQRSLKQSERSYRQLFEGSPNSMLVVSLDGGRILAVNDQALQQYGFDRGTFLARRLADLRIDADAPLPGADVVREWHCRRDGEQVLVEISSLPLEFSGQQARLLMIRDLTEQEALSQGIQQRERLIGQLMDVTVEAIFGLDVSGHCIFANQACAQLLGFSDPELLVGQHLHNLIHYQHEDGRPYPQAECRVRQGMLDGKRVHVDDEVLWRRDGTCFPVEYWSYPLWRDGQLEFCLVTFMDISERRAQQRALAHQASHDPLTGLLNRGEILQRLHDRVQTAPDGPWSLVMSNLDNFKEVNEALGHDAGDRLLQAVSRRFRDLLGPACALSRVGGDEFAFLVETADPEQACDRVRALRQIIQEPFSLSGLQVRITSSFGLVFYPDHARNPNDLIRAADVAMRRAKRDGLGVVIYQPLDGAHLNERLLLRGELRTALDQGQFLLHLQPKVILNDSLQPSGFPVGFEALTRWQHPERGLIAPGKFIPIIEVSDLIHPFTRWVVNEAIGCCARLQALQPGLSIAVNVSARNLLDVDLPQQVADALDRHHLPAPLLEFEVTETVVMADPVRALKTLHNLHALGVRLSIDDFGTGYSSFAYLNRLPVDALKIDQSFVAGMATDPDMRSIVRTIIEISHTLGLKVIAEGIETPDVLALLRDLGCDVGQGNLISPPVPVAVAEAWLQDQTLLAGSEAFPR